MIFNFLNFQKFRVTPNTPFLLPRWVVPRRGGVAVYLASMLTI